MVWNPDYKEEFKRRLKIIKRAESDPRFAEACRCHYKRNPVDFINDFCVTYDPRKKSPEPKIMPFLLFKRQREFVEYLQGCLEDGESGLTEKARDVGASWICCGFSVWLFLFHPESTVGWGSRKEEYVDKKGDPKAIFPKIRQILEHLPRFLKPEGFDLYQHATYMKINNPANGSTITGEAGDNIGRGGRTTIFFKDESAHYDRPELIEAALGDNTDVQIDISSVNGTANVFYKKRMAGEVWTKDKKIAKGITRVFIFDWKDHPNKTQEWYDRRRDKAEREGLLHIFLQEVDRDYTGSQDRIIINPQWVEAAIDSHKKLNLDVGDSVFAGQDIADGGGDKNAIVIRRGILCTDAESWSGEAGAAANIAVKKSLEHKVTNLHYDCIGVGSAFKTQMNTLRENRTAPKSLKVFPWNAGAGVIDPYGFSIDGDEDSPRNKDFYLNLKSQAWFNVRNRFYKTYRAVMFGDFCDPDDMVSIDSNLTDLHQLKLELSQAQETHNASGKVMVSKKPNGSSSPNLADAFVMCYNPVEFEEEEPVQYNGGNFYAGNSGSGWMG